MTQYSANAEIKFDENTSLQEILGMVGVARIGCVVKLILNFSS